jgi:hypothetical protein
MALNGSEGGWQFSDAADEYDRYMLRIAAGLQSGEPADALVDYLIGIEARHMGMDQALTARERATATVEAICQLVGQR